MEQLRGVALSQAVWDREVLPVRIDDFDMSDLSALCQSGDLVWVAQPNRVRFFFRGEGAVFLSAPDESSLSANARKVYDLLKSEGASFAQDLEAAFGKPPQNALVELVTAGLVTNDTLDALRAAVGASSHAPLHSELESDLAARLGARPLTRSRYYGAKRRVAKRLRAETPQVQWPGRWSLVHRAGVMGQFSGDACADKLARVLLARYGVVTRECLEREDIAGDWARLYPVFQRMELRGEIRRGYFVAGFGGAQFALPDAVEQLRAESKGEQPPVLTANESFIVVNAVDPANIFGGEVGDAPRFARVPSTHVVLPRGQPVLIAEDNGKRITTMQDAAADVIEYALHAYLTRPSAPRHILIDQWNGENVLGNARELMLHGLGFSRTPKGMEK